jgi:hypothetical protein
LALDPRKSRVYSLIVSSHLASTSSDVGLLDIDKAVVIAINTDEDVICLDYHLNHEEPCVVTSIWGKGRVIRWHIISPNFREFAQKLGF